MVYAVLWAGILPTFGRLRVFTINDLFRKSSRRQWRSHWARFGVAVLVANLAPAALLIALLAYLPDSGNWWGVAAAAVAGITPTAFPRFLHAAVLSDQTWKWFFDKEEKEAVLEEWDKLRGRSKPRASNTWFAHALAGLAVLAPSMGLAWLVGWLG